MNANGNNVSVTSFGKNFIVKFKNSNRYYEINGKGNISEPQEKIEDEFAGDITKGGKYTGADENTAYQVSCIEDLVELSIATNGGKAELNIASSNYSGKYIVLTRTLDFNSYFSYNDASTTKYKDLNGDGIEESIYLEMTKTEENCVGFTPIGTLSATFDGQENEIQNIYMKRSGKAALFADVSTVKNIGISGNITSTNDFAAGICIRTSHAIENCWNKANVTAKGSLSCAGGITSGFGGTIKNCYNTGTIVGTLYVGGIAAGHGNGTTNIENCYNTGNIGNGSSVSSASGILGTNGNIIQNCYNTGYINAGGNCYASGICSNVKTIFNCYNTANIKGNHISGICAIAVSTSIVNCYNFGLLSGSMAGGIVQKTETCSKIYNCFNIADMTYGDALSESQSGLIKENSSNIKIKNCFSKGESTKYWAGQVYGYGTCGLVANNSGTIELEDCYYVKTSHINKAVNGMKDDPTKVTALDEADEEFYTSYVELLNSYVDEYNAKSTAEKTDTNGKNLYRFKIDAETGYPVFE